jgi:protein-disulfide isomerase
MNQNTKLVVGIIAITGLLFGGLVWAIAKAPSEGISSSENVTFNDAGAPTIGKEGAAVVVHLEGDFQCPACKIAEPLMKQIIDTYKDRVLFVWKDFPLLQIHRHAQEAADAARCAQDQGKFWEYHDKLYETQDTWVAENDPAGRFAQFGRELGLKEPEFSSCVQAKSGDARVSRDIAEGLQNGVDRTPTIFVNKQRLFPTTFDAWKQVIDQELAKTASSATSTK